MRLRASPSAVASFRTATERLLTINMQQSVWSRRFSDVLILRPCNPNCGPICGPSFNDVQSSDFSECELTIVKKMNETTFNVLHLIFSLCLANISLCFFF